jgi:methyl-accepting chemotaxis protein
MIAALSSSPRPGAMTVADSLQQLAQCLAGIDQLTERAFLKLGAQIDSGQQRATALAREAAALLAPTDGETAEQIVVRLQLLTERCALWLDETRRQSQEICTILEELRRDVNTLQNPRDGLSKVVKILQSLRVATRIEAARSHGHGALVLGQELQGLSQIMQEKIGFIGERCEVLATLLLRALQVEQQAQEGSLAAARAEIGHTRQLLVGVAAQCMLATDQTTLLQRRSAELAASFGELVAALQFQDITRQRLQHITQTLRELSAHAEDEAETVLGRLCRLQHEQLQWAVDEFDAAVDRLDSNLQRMADDVQLLASETGAAVVAAGEEQCARVAPSLQAVTECLQRVQTTHLAASQALFAVCQAVGDVTLLTEEVEQLGEEMQLLAQNAAISAAHGSQHGAGLTVIADNIQQLAETAGRHAQTLTSRCRQVSARAGELDDLDQNYGGRDTELDTLLAEARSLIERLQSTGESLDRQVETLGTQARTVAGDLQLAIADFDVRHNFMAAVNPVLAGLRSFSSADVAIAAGADPLLDELQRRYTMMSQRHIHQQVINRDDAGQESELGDNVELF